MKRLLHITFALAVVALTLASQVRADAPETCKTPVFLAEFLRGLDYQNYQKKAKALVYVDGSLNCKVKKMTIIFTISDISRLGVSVFDRKEYERSVKSLPINDPRREEWKAGIGITGFGVSLKDQPVGKNLGKRIAGLGVAMEGLTKPYKPFSKTVQRMIKAYKAKEASTTVWARVRTISSEDSNVGVWMFIDLYLPHKVERRSG